MSPASFLTPFESPLIITALCYAVVFATVVNYEILSWANRHIPASTIMSFAAVQTAGTTILSCIILHTQVVIGQAVGGLGIVTGLFLVANAPTKEVDFSLSLDEEAEMKSITGRPMSELCSTSFGFGSGELDWTSQKSKNSDTYDGHHPAPDRRGLGGEADRLLGVP